MFYIDPRHALAGALAATLASTAAAAVTTFDDLDFVVGSGASQATLVLDWNDGIADESLAWGYRFDAGATAEDMLLDIVAADDRLFAAVSPAGQYGVSIYGLGYDVDGDGFAVSDNTAAPHTLFDANGIAVLNSSAEEITDLSTAADPDDHYREGFWSSGFWVLSSADGSPYGGAGSYAAPPVGISGLTLTDDLFVSLNFSPSFDFSSSASQPQAAAVPEPAAITLLLTGSLVGLARRRA